MWELDVVLLELGVLFRSGPASTFGVFFPGTLSYEDQTDAQESYASAQPWAAGLRAPGHDMHHPPMQTTSSVRA